MSYDFTRTGPEIQAIHDTVTNLPNIISNENIIPNSDFAIAGSVANAPDATPRSYSADDELFQGFRAVGALSGVTYVNGKLNGTGQLYVDIYKTEKQKLSTVAHVASIASSDGIPVESGASFVDSGDYWRITFDMTNAFSVKFEQGVNATMHDIASISKSQRWREVGDVRGWGAISGEDATQAFNLALSEKDSVIAASGEVYLVSDVSVIGKQVSGGAKIRKTVSAESAFHLLGDGSKITGMVFDAESVTGQPETDIKLGDGAKNCQIHGNTFESPIYSAISGAVDSTEGGVPYVNKVSGVTVTGNIFKSGSGKYARPVYLHSVENITIYGNIIRDCNFDAIRLRENDGYCIIDTNQFIDIGDPSWTDTQTRDAIDVYWSGAALTISNNIVRNTAFAAFDIKGISDASKNKTRRVIVTGNQIEKTRFNAIYIAGDLDNTGGDNVYIDSINVSNNIIESCGQDTSGAHGIYLENMAKYVTISENMVISCFGRGIYAHNSDQSKDIVKSISVCDNICVNNGLQSNQVFTEAGINLQAIDGLIVRGNICENDAEMDNPYQASGIFIQSVAGVFAPEKTALITGNICRNNTVSQISTESNGSRANNIASFRDNLQVGPGALQRQWHDQRTVMHGSSAPATGDGEFRAGDVIWNISPTAGGFAGWICVAGGTPGTWQTFGSISP